MRLVFFFFIVCCFSCFLVTRVWLDGSLVSARASQTWSPIISRQQLHAWSGNSTTGAKRSPERHQERFGGGREGVGGMGCFSQVSGKKQNKTKQYLLRAAAPHDREF